MVDITQFNRIDMAAQSLFHQNDPSRLQSEPSEVVVERSISATAEQAYEAWADAGKLSRWFGTRAKQDLRVGGRYSNSDGETGEFLEVVPHRRLRFTWEQPQYPPGSQVAVEFLPEAEDVLTVRLVHSGLRRQDDVARVAEGWEWALDSLKSFLEAGEELPYREWLSRKEMGH